MTDLNEQTVATVSAESGSGRCLQILQSIGVDVIYQQAMFVICY